jgi:hypothetical protein
MLQKLDLFFGNVLTVEELYGAFYVAEQTKGEKIGTWALSVQDLLSNLGKKDPSVLIEITKEKMLRSRFFAGLRPDGVKEKIRHQYDSQASYQQLVLASRAAELEQGSNRARVQQESVTVDQNMGKKLDLILAQLAKVDERVKGIEDREKSREEKAVKPDRSFGSQDARKQTSNRGNSNTTHRPFTGTCFGCGMTGHRRNECPEN